MALRRNSELGPRTYDKRMLKRGLMGTAVTQSLAGC